MSVQPLFLYLHGFLSSPDSIKAQQTLEYCQGIGLGDRIIIPALGSGPAMTMASLRQIVESNPGEKIALIGSSLGGYYATNLAEHYGFPAALINPAVRPYELWQNYLGENKNYYTGEIHTVSESDIDELRVLDVSKLSEPENLLLLVQTGDATLDYRLAVQKYQLSAQIVRQGGSHSYENYEAELPAVFDFLLSRIG